MAERRELRDYQARAIDELRQAMAEKCKAPLLQAPTGAGKTAIACAIAQSAVEKGRLVYFTVPALALINQTVDDFIGQGIYSIGVIQANHPLTNRDRMVQICSLQTLSRRNVPPPDLIIVDEAHRRDKHVSELMRDPRWAKTKWIGLSATPWSKGLGTDYDKLIVVTTTAELIASGRLSPFRVFAPSHPDLSGVGMVAGDYNEGQLSRVMSQKKIVGDVVENWITLGENRPTLCFCVDRGHAQAVHDSFVAAGIASAYQDGETSPEDRADIARKFASGDIKVVCNIGTLTTGVDWDVRCIILARPTKSEMLYVQIIGRGLRTAPGKNDCIIIDHSDTTLNLGFVTDIHHDELDAGTKRGPADRTDPAERVEPLPKACQSCGVLKSPKVHKCPKCGHEPRRKDKTAVIDGKLSELKANGMRVDAGPESPGFWFANMRRYQIDHGYQDGWASNKFREKFGAWPPRRGLPPAAEKLDPAVGAWIRSRQIAWAKSRRNTDGAVQL